MKAAMRHKLARAAADAAIGEVLARKAPRAPGHAHRGRCGRKCFPPETPKPHDPEAVGGTD